MTLNPPCRKPLLYLSFYYLLFFLGIVGIVKGIKEIKKKEKENIEKVIGKRGQTLQLSLVSI